MATDTKIHHNSDSYKPNVIPKALKVIEGYRDDMTKVDESEDKSEHTDTSGEGGDPVSEQAVTANISGSSIVLLVADVRKSSDFYKNLGFKYEEVGGPKVKHVHVSRGNLTFILHPAINKEDVRPSSSVEGGLYFDAYAYTDAIDLLVEECRSKGVEIVDGPHFSEHWSEFTFKDAEGYRITFGGGVSTKLE